MGNEIFLFDMIGTFAFASYGSYFAIKRDFDIFGIFVCAFLPGVGGGTMRELILGHVPFYFYDSRYIINILLAIIFTIVVYKKFNKLNELMLFLDAIGLVAFAIIGAEKAFDAGLGLFGFVFFATITPVGGGIMRSVVMNEVPEIMHSQFYATVGIMIGTLLWLNQDLIHDVLFINAIFFASLLLRMIAIKANLNLWKPPKEIEFSCLFRKKSVVLQETEIE